MYRSLICNDSGALIEDPQEVPAMLAASVTSSPSKRGDTREDVRHDAGEIEVVIDGERWCQDVPSNEWVRCSDLGEGSHP